MANNVFKRIPSVTELIEKAPLKTMVDKVSHNVVVNEVRSFLDNMRQEIKSKADDYQVPSANELAERIADWIAKEERPRLAPVINATGVLLHTGLGRAPLGASAVDAVAAVASHYSSLEIEAESGERGQRMRVVKRLLCEITGAKAALVCNNNAAATMLALSHLAKGREVIVSRGELIEIGGSYRLPDVMSASGAILREVGTTNKTRISDYERACGENTAAIMRCHTSNFRIVGFTESPSTDELVALAAMQNVPFVDDIGSGALLDLAPYGIRDEPLARDSIAAGADAVLLSGDKLLGGPQCGIIVGRKKYVDAMAKHPMMRALRVGKMTLAALAATLELYRNETQAKEHIPFLRLLTTSIENLENRARRLAPQLATAKAVEEAEAIENQSQLGGGSVPAQTIPTWCIALKPAGMSVDQLARRLRTSPSAVYGRIQNDRLLLDLRTVFASQDTQLVSALEALEA